MKTIKLSALSREDLYLNVDEDQGIFCKIDVVAPVRNVTFEWFASELGQTSDVYHFQIIYQESLPNSFIFNYFEITDSGASATVGAQTSVTSQYAQYSYLVPDVTPNSALLFDPIENDFVPIPLQAGAVGVCVAE